MTVLAFLAVSGWTLVILLGFLAYGFWRVTGDWRVRAEQSAMALARAKGQLRELVHMQCGSWDDEPTQPDLVKVIVDEALLKKSFGGGD